MTEIISGCPDNGRECLRGCGRRYENVDVLSIFVAAFHGNVKLNKTAICGPITEQVQLLLKIARQLNIKGKRA